MNDTVTITLFYAEMTPGTVHYWTLPGFFGSWHSLPPSVQTAICVVNVLEPGDYASGVGCRYKNSYILENIPCIDWDSMKDWIDDTA